MILSTIGERGRVSAPSSVSRGADATPLADSSQNSGWVHFMKTSRRLLAFAVFVLAATAFAGEPKLSRFEYSEPHMGTTFRLVLYAANREIADQAAKDAFARVEQLNRIMSD